MEKGDKTQEWQGGKGRENWKGEKEYKKGIVINVCFHFPVAVLVGFVGYVGFPNVPLSVYL